MKIFNNFLKRKQYNMETIKLFDSFAGIGALHQSLKELGVPVEVVGMSEIDVDAIISYGARDGGNLDKSSKNFNFPSKEEMKDYLIKRNIGYDFKKGTSKIPRLSEKKLKQCYKVCVEYNNYGDVSIIEPNDIVDFDLFNMSFPCTNLSVAGKQQGMVDEQGNKTASGLYVDGIKIIKAKKPKYIMIENVKNLIGKKFINDFYAIINEIESIGYKCHYATKENGTPKCLNAKDFGIPQNRERIFVICARNDIDLTFEFPKGFDNGIRLKDLLEDEVDDKYYLSKEIQTKFKLCDKTTPQDDCEKLSKNTKEYQPKDCIEPKRLGGIFDTEESKHQAGSVWDKEYISPTIDTMQGGYRQPLVVELDEETKLEIKDKYKIPNDNNLNIIENSKSKKQNEEHNVKEDCDECNLFHTTTSDNNNKTTKIIERTEKPSKPQQLVEQLIETNQINSNVVPTDSTLLKPKALDFANCITARYDAGIQNKQSIGVCVVEKVNDNELSQSSSTNKINVVGNYSPSNHNASRVVDIEGISPTVMENHGTVTAINTFRVRKLTPKECWRLMGFRDECIDRCIEQGISNSQLYKQAGNSIVVNVLYYIFEQVFKEYETKENKNNEEESYIEQ